MKFDILVCGSDLAAAIMAERLANDLGKSVLVVDHRSHIGGHCYDRWSNNGVRVDQYGMKMFCASPKYLSAFTQWTRVQFRILWTQGSRYVTMPIALSEEREKIKHPENGEEFLFSTIGIESTERLRRYIERLIGCDLDDATAPAMKSLIESKKFGDMLPTEGFTRMFERILKSNKIKIMLQAPWREVEKKVAVGHTIFTGPMDDYFDHRFGALQYRSMEFQFDDLDYASHQPCLQINNCDKGEHSRVIDYSYLAPHPVQRTTICTEYPKSTGEPFYPMLTASARAEHAKYAELAATEKHVTFVGPLANYRDERLDDTVTSTLAAYERLKISLTSGKAR